MANSVLTYIGDGVTTTFPLNFTLGLLEGDTVSCQVGDEEDASGNPIYRAWTHPGGNTGLAQVQGVTPLLGERVVFTRTVSSDELIHNYQKGDPLDEKSLDESFKQCLMLAHQALDGRVTMGADLNMRGFTVRGIGSDPLDPTSAVTWEDLAGAEDAVYADAERAEEAADRAEAAAQDAERDMNSATIAAQAASSSAQEARTTLEEIIIIEENVEGLLPSITDAGNAAVESIRTAEAQGVAAIGTAEEGALTDITIAKDAAVSAVSAGTDAQISRVESAGAAQRDLISVAGAGVVEHISNEEVSAIQAISQAEATAVSAVQQEGSNQTAAVTAAGTAAIASIGTSVDDAEAAALLAQAWAESDTTPDPALPDSRSAKGWAEWLAEQSSSVPEATTTISGKSRYATTAEVLAGTVTTATVTPKSLADALPTIAPIPDIQDATTTVKGIVQFATDAEAEAGTSTDTVVTPAQLNAYGGGGGGGIATDEEYESGTAVDKAPSVKQVKTDINTLQDGAFISTPSIPLPTLSASGVAFVDYYSVHGTPTQSGYDAWKITKDFDEYNDGRNYDWFLSTSGNNSVQFSFSVALNILSMDVKAVGYNNSTAYTSSGATLQVTYDKVNWVTIKQISLNTAPLSVTTIDLTDIEEAVYGIKLVKLVNYQNRPGLGRVRFTLAESTSIPVKSEVLENKSNIELLNASIEEVEQEANVQIGELQHQIYDTTPITELATLPSLTANGTPWTDEYAVVGVGTVHPYQPYWLTQAFDSYVGGASTNDWWNASSNTNSISFYFQTPLPISGVDIKQQGYQAATYYSTKSLTLQVTYDKTTWVTVGAVTVNETSLSVTHADVDGSLIGPVYGVRFNNCTATSGRPGLGRVRFYVSNDTLRGMVEDNTSKIEAFDADISGKLDLTGGTLTGPLNSTSYIVAPNIYVDSTYAYPGYYIDKDGDRKAAIIYNSVSDTVDVATGTGYMKTVRALSGAFTGGNVTVTGSVISNAAVSCNSLILNGWTITIES